MKAAIRKIVDTLVGTPVASVGFGRKGLLILTYHRILPRDHGDLAIVEPGVLVHNDTFFQHLSILKQHFEMVDLGEWLADKRNGRALPKRACAITFDDGWRDNYEYAFPALQEAGVPATIFVVAGLVGTNAQFWPERLARAIMHRGSMQWTGKQSPWLNKLVATENGSTDPLNAEQISKVVQHAKRFSDAEVHQALDEVNRLEGRAAEMVLDLLDWDQCREMVDSGLVSIGSHTTNHVRLRTGLSPDVLQEEVQGSRQLISNQVGKECELFCYPNGDMCDAAVAAVASSYSGACTTRVGWNGRETQPYLLSRINIHEGRAATKNGFLTCLTGWL